MERFRDLEPREKSQMPDTLHEKNALITGGSSGIGRAIALGLASRGCNVVVGYLKDDVGAREVVTAAGDYRVQATAVRADLARRAEVTRLFDEAEHIAGPLDIVVASAADILVKPLVECTEEDYDRIFNTNVRGVFFTLKESARRVRDGGRIVVLSTGGTKLFYPDQSLYLGSKGAVEQFVRCLAWELAGRGITVNAISPGPTETRMMQDRYRDRAARMSPFNRVGVPRDVADVAIFLASENARWVTGQNICAGGGAF
jgi:3-oxoacyl-[acyl-carrier protein] reductase